MGLKPVKIMWPYRLDPSEEISFTLEDQIQTAKAVFQPLLRMYNSSGADMQLKVVHLLDLGFGDDPLVSGTYPFTVVDTTVATDNLYDYNPGTQLDLDAILTTRHTVTVTNLDTVEPRIVRFILFGMSDIKATLPANEDIVRTIVS